MIPVAFDYERATSAEHALALLAEHGDDAKLLAGGHSLLPLMKYRLAAPALVVDIGRLSDLSYVREDGDVLAIGALTRHRDVETSELVRAQAGLLAAATSKAAIASTARRIGSDWSATLFDKSSNKSSSRVRARSPLSAMRPSKSESSIVEKRITFDMVCRCMKVSFKGGSIKVSARRAVTSTK